MPLRGGQIGLRGRISSAPEGVHDWQFERVRELDGLIESPRASPPEMQRHRYYTIRPAEHFRTVLPHQLRERSRGGPPGAVLQCMDDRSKRPVIWAYRTRERDDW
jgi:hypothetical protein